MLRKKFSFDYVTSIKYALLFLIMIVFGNLEKDFSIYNSAIFVMALALGSNVITTTIFYLATYLIMGKIGLLPATSIIATFFAVIICIYRKKRIKPKIELSAYMIIALIGYVFLGDTTTFIPIEKRLLTATFTCLLTLISVVAGTTVNDKGLKYKLDYGELASIIVMVSLLGLGVCNFISPYVWRGLIILIILVSCMLFNYGACTIISAVLGISLAVFYGQISYVALTLVWGICALGFMPISKYLSAVSVIVCDYLIQVIFGFYGQYLLADFISILIGCATFTLIPNKPLKKLKETISLFKEKQIAKETINRTRLMASNRLFELSTVFLEMANAFNSLNDNNLDEQGVKKAIIDEVTQKLCVECEYQNKCRITQSVKKNELNKLIDIGLAKGKTSLIDLPKELGNNCIKVNSLLFTVNKLIIDYRNYTLERLNVKTGRELICDQAVGVSEILKGLALETGALLKYQSKIENDLRNNLQKKGFRVGEILIYGEDDFITVGIILTMREFSLNLLTSTISNAVGRPVALVEKANITEDKVYLSFKKSANYDAVFGVRQVTKDGSDKCGDTHSVTRIREDKFLVAVSDGMGSGKKAEAVSATSLSLIESFYKAGLSGNLILNTVNKLLAINTEDTFTALDVSIIDLKTCTADFIKYGAPYGFIISDAGIKIVESNTLPIGILEELKPSVCQAQLNDGDMLLLISDGVADAFNSSSEIIDFLKTVPAKNPQTLADDIVSNAIKRNNNSKPDDMTALCVRIYKPVA